MPLFHHAGALGDFILSLPFLRALARLRLSSEWTLAVSEDHARLVSRIFPHRRRIAPGSVELAPLGSRALDDARIADLAARHGGLFGFVPRAKEVEAIVKDRCPDAAVALAEPFARAVPSGRSIENVLEQVIRRVNGRSVRLGPEEFAIRRDELPRLESGASSARPLDRVALLHPGAGDPAKMTPLQLFVELARLLESRKIHVTWVRGPVEAERGDPMPPGDVLDCPDLLLLAHATARATVYIGNDSGPTHLASALGAPTLALHAAPNPAWRPRGARSLLADLSRERPRPLDLLDRLLES